MKDIQLYGYTVFCLSIHNLKTLELASFCMDICCQFSLNLGVEFLGYVVTNLSRNCQTVFQSGCAISLSPFQYMLLSFILIITICVGIVTVEVKNKNRFKGLDLIECLMNYGRTFMTLYRRQGSKPIPKKKKCKKSKMAVWGGLTNTCEKKKSNKQRRKGKI